MSLFGQNVLRIILTALFLATLGILTRIPLGQEPDLGVLRLAWRLSNQKVKFCRPYTASELAQIPIHMRQAELCEDKLLPFRLDVEINGHKVLEKEVHPAGLRGDRPLTVFENIETSPGAKEIAVRFIPLPARSFAPSGSLTEDQEETLEEAVEHAPHFEFQQKVSFEKGRIVLVALNTENELVVK